MLANLEIPRARRIWRARGAVWVGKNYFFADLESSDDSWSFEKIFIKKVEKLKKWFYVEKSALGVKNGS